MPGADEAAEFESGVPIWDGLAEDKVVGYFGEVVVVVGF